MKKSINLSSLLLIFFFILLMRSFFLGQSVSPLPYSEFKDHLRENHIKELTISGDKISGTFTKPLEGPILIKSSSIKLTNVFQAEWF